MPTSIEWAAVFGVLIVAGVLFAHTVGYFTLLPAPAVWPVFLATLLVLIFTPAVMSKARWTVLGAMVAGVVVIIVNILGLVRGCTMSTAYMPIMSIVLALLFTYFSYRACQQK